MFKNPSFRYICIVKYKNEEFKYKRYKVAVFAASKCNLKYDWRGVIGFVIKWVKQNNKLYFCSEMCLWALQEVFPKALNSMRPENCMPADFLNPKYFEVVWEGII